jgi:spore coat polysaccharide biosynthesis protein SpsF
MEALGFIPADIKILACPEDSVSVFAPLAEEANFSLLPGPKEDVLARFSLALCRSGADKIIRATGDNPFVFVDAAATLHQEAVELAADYACYFGIPYGTGVEFIRSEALLRAEDEAKDPFDREHVCSYLYKHPELFRLHRPLAPSRWQGHELRLTVDTAEDYERAQILYGRLSSIAPEERNLGESIIASYKK